MSGIKTLIGPVLCIIAGILILLVGIFSVYITLTSFEEILALLSKFLPSEIVEYWRKVGPTPLAAWYMIFGCAFGIFVILFGIFGLTNKYRTLSGILAASFSILSFFGGGGLLIGLILGIIGGILTVLLKD